MKRREAESVGDIIARLIESTGQSENYDRQRACYLWAEVAGPAINRCTSRRYVTDDGVMHVHLTSASLKAELEGVRASLTQRINQALGHTVITQIRIH